MQGRSTIIYSDFWNHRKTDFNLQQNIIHNIPQTNYFSVACKNAGASGTLSLEDGVWWKGHASQALRPLNWEGGTSGNRDPETWSAI